jgi:glucokinase
MTQPNSTTRLLADVGGTNARFAWQDHAHAPLIHVRVLPGADYPTLQAAMRAYIDGVGQGEPTEAAIAIANPITGDAVRMTNHHWAFSQAAVRAEFGLRRLRLLNDFTALALALPDLTPEQLRQVGGQAALADEPKALIGAGTGLGVSGLLPNGQGGWVPVQGEGGHVTLPAETARERLLMDGLTARYGHASSERLLCGQGLLDAFEILCAADAAATSGINSPAAVTEAALQARHPQAVEALALFCALLGSCAGNLALTLGARGGVYIGGGIAPRLGAALDASAFRQRFEAKGRFQGFLQAIPVWVITADPSPALLGAARALD